MSDISIPEFTLLILASWRTAFFLVYDSGPFGVLVRMRTLLGMEFDDEGVLISFPERFPATLFACVLCMSAWTAAGIYGIFVLEPRIVLVLGLWGGASLVESARTR